MTPEQFRIRQELKKLANPEGDDASWGKRKAVEATANIAVDQKICRNSELGCALCEIAEVTCNDVNGLLAELHCDEGAITVE